MDARGVGRLLVVGAFVLPTRTLHEAPMLCAFHRVTGRPCPSCGLSRSWQAVAHGRLREGFEHHPLGPLAFATATWIALDGSADDRLAAADRRWLAVIAGLWTTVWLWRVSRPTPR